jgi:hypothetical protein
LGIEVSSWSLLSNVLSPVSSHQEQRSGDAIAESDVTSTRKDGSTVTAPVVTIYRSGGELIDDYRVYLDVAPLFA